MLRNTLFPLPLLLVILLPRCSQGQVTYVEAIIDPSDGTVNTFLADGSPAVAGTHYKDIGTQRPSDALSENDDQWDLRRGFGANGGNVITAGNGGSREDAPILRVTINGLTPGESYNTFAYFYDLAQDGQDNNTWRGRANNSGETDFFNGRLVGDYFGNWNPLNENGELPFTELTYDDSGNNPGPITTDSANDPVSTNVPSPATENGGYFSNSPIVRFDDKFMVQAELGVSVADSNGEVFVYIDDGPSRNIDRTWFDGVGYSVAVEMLFGDFDGSGTVDGTDLMEWENNYGQDESVFASPGNANGSGTVDGGDFLLWQGNLGSSAISAATAVVPEPHTLLLGLLGVVTGASVLRKRY